MMEKIRHAKRLWDSLVEQGERFGSFYPALQAFRERSCPGTLGNALEEFLFDLQELQYDANLEDMAASPPREYRGYASPFFHEDPEEMGDSWEDPAPVPIEGTKRILLGRTISPLSKPQRFEVSDWGSWISGEKLFFFNDTSRKELRNSPGKRVLALVAKNRMGGWLIPLF